MISGVSNNVMALRDAHERVGKAAHDIANSNPQNVEGGQEVPPVKSIDSANSGVKNDRDSSGIANSNPQNIGQGEDDPAGVEQGANDRAAAVEEHVASREERGLDPTEGLKAGLTIDPADGVSKEDGAPMANSIEELVRAKMDHGANIAVIRTQDEMLGSLLDAFG